jgi:capsule polysaccharide export protein KpsC/LpsZ
MFYKLSLQEKKKGIIWAKKQLNRRLSGEIGVDMPYATKSAFKLPKKEKHALKKSKNIKVLICSHCFFDNPHGFGGMLFVDFYEWLRFLGKISQKTNYDWYLKVHPDPLPGTLETIKTILSDFPKITLIPHETSHRQLAKEGINFVLTAYGSVGHEYPALGVQVINAAYNPRVAYDFNWHPKSLKEYEHLLLNLNKLHKKIDLNELYEFYFMYHNYIPADDLVLKSYRQSLSDLTTKERIGSKIYEYFLSQLTPIKHQETIDKMQKFIDSGKHFYFSRGPE